MQTNFCIQLLTNSTKLDKNFLVFNLAQATSRILEAHANVKELGLVDAKLKFIQAWQSLPEYGVTLFVIKFDGHKKEELLGVAHNRIMRMDVNNGDHLKTWRYNTMKVSINTKISATMKITSIFFLSFQIQRRGT